MVIGDLFKIERILTEIQFSEKFEMRLDKYVKLCEHICFVKKYTNMFFKLQEEHKKSYGNKELLNELHKRLWKDELDINVNDVLAFIKEIYDETENENLKETIDIELQLTDF